MENIRDLFTNNLSFENNLDEDTATRIVTWLENEGVLDYDVLKEVYGEGDGGSVGIQQAA